MEKMPNKQTILGMRALLPGIALSAFVSGLAVLAERLELRLTGGAWIEALGDEADPDRVVHRLREGVERDPAQGAEAGMSGRTSAGEELSGLKFGYPSMVQLPDGDVLAVFWCCEDCIHNIRWVRLRIDRG